MKQETETLEHYRQMRPWEALEDLEIAHGHKTESHDVVFLLRMVREQKELAQHLRRTATNLEAKLRALCLGELDEDPKKQAELNIWQLVSKLANAHFYAKSAAAGYKKQLDELHYALVHPELPPPSSGKAGE